MDDNKNLGSEPIAHFVQSSAQSRLTLYIKYYAPVCHGLKCYTLLYYIWTTQWHVVLPSIIFEIKVMMGHLAALIVFSSS